MRLSKIEIKNFRNFQHLSVVLGESAVIVGENKLGKSNLVHALRLILDPSLPDTARQLRFEDFWDGLPRPIDAGVMIEINVEFTDFENDKNLLAILGEYLVAFKPVTARLNYIFRRQEGFEGEPVAESQFAHRLFGGEDESKLFSFDLRRRLRMDVFHALRDAESDLESWKRSPLRHLLTSACDQIDPKILAGIVRRVTAASNELTTLGEISSLNTDVVQRLQDMVGSYHSFDVSLGLHSTDSDRLIRAMRLFIDSGSRGISDASLGSANLIYLVLKALELNQLAKSDERDHTILTIEEPEAHLHPHLQRLVYRNFLTSRKHIEVQSKEESDRDPAVCQTTFLTTHSPHIVSVSPLRSLVLLKRSLDRQSTIACSTADLDLSPRDVEDLERYLDVSRGEIAFCRAVLLVEGDAESFLLPNLARLNGFDLDELGISICSVAGTNFEPYVKLVGPNGLDIPFAVVTDYDPIDSGGGLAESRVKKLIGVITDTTTTFPDSKSLFSKGKLLGVFVGEYTLEVDIYNSGQKGSICKTICELTENGAAAARAAAWQSGALSPDFEVMLSDVKAIGKGRFAQRLASNLDENKCPLYILDALNFLVSKLK